MSADVFGNLREWGRVLDRLAELNKTGTLEEHQDGLARLLRYPDNWRLREAALEAVREVRRPSADLSTQVLAIMMDEGLYWHARILAAEALSGFVRKAAEESGRAAAPDASKVAEEMKRILSLPRAPVFDQGIRRFLEALEKVRDSRRAPACGKG